MSNKRKKKVKQPKTQNLVAKFAHLYNICKVIDTNDKKYKRKSKHKVNLDYLGVSIA